jgi:hypothetical protein
MFDIRKLHHVRRSSPGNWSEMASFLFKNPFTAPWPDFYAKL